MAASTPSNKTDSSSTEQTAQQFLTNADEYFRTEIKCMTDITSNKTYE